MDGWGAGRAVVAGAGGSGGAERVGQADERSAAAVPEGAVDVAAGDGAGVLPDGRGASGGVSVAGAGAGAATAGVQRAGNGAPLRCGGSLPGAAHARAAGRAGAATAARGDE